MSFSLSEVSSMKSVVPVYKFTGDFEGDEQARLNIVDFHIVSVSYEHLTFKQDGVYHGPGILKTFPVLDRGESGAYKLTVTFEEDSKGTIFKFIQYLQALIIGQNGVYEPYENVKKLQFNLRIFTNPQTVITFKELYFQGAEGNEHSYGGADAKTYTITFAYDYYTVEYIE